MSSFIADWRKKSLPKYFAHGAGNGCGGCVNVLFSLLFNTLYDCEIL